MLTDQQTKYKGVIIQGSTFPDSPYKIVPVKLNDTIKKFYLSELDKLTYKKSLKLLMTAMTHQEGFTNGKKPSRSFRTNNPGNVGNTDSGANRGFKTLREGIEAQAKHLQDIAAGKSKYYPLGKLVECDPYYSPEIANNPQYGLPPYLPGYSFIYTGQLDQFIKIYSTGARVTNSYLNTIISYFAANGMTITPEAKLSELV